jgi:GNAT superfamily N-acetyltransferase
MLKGLNEFKQYGVKNGFIRLIKSIVRKFEIEHEVYLYCTKQIVDDFDLDSNEIKRPFIVKELSFEDFKKALHMQFSESKLKLIQNRLQKGTYHSYGIYIDGVLAYTTWISLYEFEMSKTIANGFLAKNEGLIIDSYCHPDYRGLGIHSFMSKFRINELKKYGKNKSVVIMLKENLPTQKAHFNAGYEIEKYLHYLKIFKFEKIKTKKFK